VYAKEYFHLVERIPGIVARVRDRVSDRKLAGRIDENMHEEQEHVELWKRFAKSLGISEQELMAHVPSQKVIDAVHSLEVVAEQGSDEGITCMYALEAELPKIAQSKKDGLCKFYGLTSEDAQIYFDEHLKEEKHLEVWRTFEVDEVKAEPAADTSLTAQHLVLDAVCDARGISMC
jgi:pyrroloquinoline-quinone synthase